MSNTAPISDVAVRPRNLPSSSTLAPSTSTLTGKTGVFALPPGSYRVKAVKTGFVAAEVPVEIKVGEDKKVQLRLEEITYINAASPPSDSGWVPQRSNPEPYSPPPEYVPYEPAYQPPAYEPPAPPAAPAGDSPVLPDEY